MLPLRYLVWMSTVPDCFAPLSDSIIRLWPSRTIWELFAKRIDPESSISSATRVTSEALISSIFAPRPAWICWPTSTIWSMFTVPWPITPSSAAVWKRLLRLAVWLMTILLQIFIFMYFCSQKIPKALGENKLARKSIYFQLLW